MNNIDTGAWTWTNTNLKIGDATIMSGKTLRTNVFPDDIVDVIYNPPATVIHWSDKTKTVVKCSADDEYDPLTGFCSVLPNEHLISQHSKQTKG